MSDSTQPHTPTNKQPNSTYFSDFQNLILASGLTSIGIKTILSPLERWKIIAQTQYYYPLRPKKFANFLDFVKSISNHTQESPMNKVSFHSGEAIWSTPWCTSINSSFKSSSLIPSGRMLNRIKSLTETISYHIFYIGNTHPLTHWTSSFGFIRINDPPSSTWFLSSQDLDVLSQIG